MSAARLGAQVTPAAYQRRNTVPCFASRSRFGVFQSFRPLNPTSPHPRSSARIKTMLGGVSRAADGDDTKDTKARKKRIKPGFINADSAFNVSRSFGRFCAATPCGGAL